MKTWIKGTTQGILANKAWDRLRSIRNVNLAKRAYRIDRKKYTKYSRTFGIKSFEHLECEITLLYHEIEKGFLFEETRPYFAKAKVTALLSHLKDNEVEGHWNSTHIQSAIANLCNYYEWHTEHNYPLECFSETEYSRLEDKLISKLPSTQLEKCSEFFAKNNSPFPEFARSRASVRGFSGELVDHLTLTKVIDLANSAPSVCNRRGVVVNIIENKKIIGMANEEVRTTLSLRRTHEENLQFYS